MSVCYNIVYYYNGAQRYEQFLQVGWLHQALILLDLALCLPSASVSSVLMVLYRYYFLVHPSLYLLVGWAWWDWLTIFLQCYDTVGWVMWPIKSSSKWPIVSNGTLNPTMPYLMIPGKLWWWWWWWWWYRWWCNVRVYKPAGDQWNSSEPRSRHSRQQGHNRLSSLQLKDL